MEGFGETGYHADPLNFACDKCQKRYSIADDKVRGRTVRIRCKNCQNVMSVQEADAILDPKVDAATAMLAPHRVDELKKKDRAFAEQDGARTARRDGAGNVIVSGQWFAMVKGKQVGPLEGPGLMSKAKSGEITPRTYLWKEGMADWKRAADLEEMTELFGGSLGPPPPPTGTPVP
ncbi:MAG: GYF domain-containing protein, partial [Myxococcaceae bacterium]